MEAPEDLAGIADPDMLRVLRGILHSQRELLKRMETVESDLKFLTARVSGAFPGADGDAHRRAHEAMIERTAELRRLRVAIQEKTIGGLVWAAMIAVGLAMWKYIIGIIKGAAV